MNTMFKQHARLYTWISPEDEYRNQIVMINRRYRNFVRNVTTFPGANIDSDHVPVIMKIKLKLKRIQKERRPPRLNLELLKVVGVRNSFSILVRNKFDLLMDEEPISGSGDLRQW